MKFNVRENEINISDELVKEYIKRTDVCEELLPQAIDLHYRRAKHNSDVFGNDISKAIEASIRNELQLWE